MIGKQQYLALCSHANQFLTIHRRPHISYLLNKHTTQSDQDRGEKCGHSNRERCIFGESVCSVTKVNSINQYLQTNNGVYRKMTQIEHCVSWFSGLIVFTKVHVWATFLRFSTLALKYLLLPWEMQNLEEVLGCREPSFSTHARVHHLCPLSWSRNLGVPPQVYFSPHRCICKRAARPCQVTCSSRSTYP